MRAQSGSIESIAGTEPENSSLSQSPEAAPAAVEAADGGRHLPDSAAAGTANGMAHTEAADLPDRGAAVTGEADGVGKLSTKHFRRYSTGEDFEASAGPRGKDGYGDATDTRHVSAGSRWYDPRKDVVLRIECATDAQSRVRDAWCYMTSSFRQSRS